ncbi:MAG TPA: AzlD domain-containing protein [Burkholderiaceae bacterium]|nr:AzlD domain-containing protein [Burkholderiaceae bacterium]
MNTIELVIVVVGMAAITLITRGFFFLQRAQLPVPAWLTEGLRYAPLAAMVAVVAPEIVMSQGQLITTWKDARLYGAAAATAWYFWRRDMFGTIVAGTAVLLALRLTLGW